ncbi:MAG: hypothetical protein IAG10_10255 [Planctomycetaceae bacterium]|nr:hypothetical protein [Planctomycetaceae bacterium]
MHARLAIFCAVLLGGMASPLRAELYEFEVKGRVVGGFLSLYQVAVGDEVTFRYLMDSTDQDPSTIGRYRGTTAFFETPAGTFSGNEAKGGDFTVHNPFASFDSYTLGSAIKLSLRFPAGTLLTDELPLTLPVSIATTRSFFVHPGSVVPSLHGTITSYQSRLVPEPNSLCVFGVAGTALRRRRT